MTDDLLAQDVLAGKTQDEVRELLGEPDFFEPTGIFVYKTDPGAWLGGANNGPWIHYLNISFGKDQRVIGANITD